MKQTLLLTLAVWRIRLNLGPPSGLSIDDKCLLAELTSRGVTWYDGDEWSGDDVTLSRFSDGEVVAVRPAHQPRAEITRHACQMIECETDGSEPEPARAESRSLTETGSVAVA